MRGAQEAMMNPHSSNDRTDVLTSRHVRPMRLQALLFTRAAFGTAVMTLGEAASPKLPPFVGE
jgi:hypothetical protein